MRYLVRKCNRPTHQTFPWVQRVEPATEDRTKTPFVGTPPRAEAWRQGRGAGTMNFCVSCQELSHSTVSGPAGRLRYEGSRLSLFCLGLIVC